LGQAINGLAVPLGQFMAQRAYKPPHSGVTLSRNCFQASLRLIGKLERSGRRRLWLLRMRRRERRHCRVDRPLRSWATVARVYETRFTPGDRDHLKKILADIRNVRSTCRRSRKAQVLGYRSCVRSWWAMGARSGQHRTAAAAVRYSIHPATRQGASGVKSAPQVIHLQAGAPSTAAPRVSLSVALTLPPST